MELFDKIYSCYYQVVEQILKSAADHPVSRTEMEELSGKYGFAESALTIVPKLLNGEWAFLRESDSGTYESSLKNPAVLPLTALQLAWLKALLADRRFALFLTDEELAEAKIWLEAVKPLYHDRDFHYYDRYQDGDSYDDPDYQKRFRTILEAIRQKHCLIIAYRSRKQTCFTCELVPLELEYSSKNDKFRLWGREQQKDHNSPLTVFNLERINACHLSKKHIPECEWNMSERGTYERLAAKSRAERPVTMLISGKRNSLERTMLHFASYEKRTEYDAEHQAYVCDIYYDKADETELLIDILSFGPSIEVLGPESFLSLIQERVVKQHQLFYG